MDCWRKWKANENKDDFSAKRKSHNSRSSVVWTDDFIAAVKRLLTMMVVRAMQRSLLSLVVISQLFVER